MGVLGGKSEEENHAHLPQFRTVGETVWGLGLNSSEEPLGPCGEDDGWSESGRGVPSASLDPPRHRPPEECVRVSEEDLEFGLRGEGEAADKTDVPDVPVAKKWPGLSRGGSVSKKNFVDTWAGGGRCREGRGGAVVVVVAAVLIREEGIEGPSYDLRDGTGG